MAAHDDDHGHDHGELSFEGCEVDDETLEMLRAEHPLLAENLELSRTHAELDDEKRARLIETQKEIEMREGWMPGYHAEGDKCGGCGAPNEPLYADLLNGARLPYACFFLDLPVHPRDACVTRLRERIPRPAPQVLDRLRRELTTEGGRPSSRLTQFFRHDVLAHPPFGLEDWANSVAEANAEFNRASRKDIERLLMWVHGRVFHH